MALAQLKFPVILFGAAQLMKMAALRNADFKARLREHNLVAQIMTRDEEIGRWIAIDNGKVRSGPGLHAKPDIRLMFKNAEIGASLLPRRSTGSIRSTLKKTSSSQSKAKSA